jgi:serine/threonine protein kinase
MEALHMLGVPHGHLTCENVFLDDNFEVRVGGFGQHRLPPESALGLQLCPYAPETLLSEDPLEITVQADVYSYAILLYSMFKEPTFLADVPMNRITARADLVAAVSRGDRFVKDSAIPEFYWKLITLCWKPDPANRPQFSDIVELLVQSLGDCMLPGADAVEVRAYAEKVTQQHSPEARSSKLLDEYRPHRATLPEAPRPEWAPPPSEFPALPPPSEFPPLPPSSEFPALPPPSEFPVLPPPIAAPVVPHPVEPVSPLIEVVTPLTTSDAVNVLILGGANSSKAALTRQFVIENWKAEERPATYPSTAQLEICQQMTTIVALNATGLGSISLVWWQRAHGIALVYDQAVRETFDSLDYWFDVIGSNAKPGIPVIVCGDRAGEGCAKVGAQDARKLAHRHRALFLEVSTATGERVNELFLRLATAVVRLRLNEGAASVPTRKPGEPPAALVPTYTIHVAKASASLKSHGKFSGLHLELSLEGGLQNVKSKEVRYSASPSWDELMTLDGYSIGSDVLNVLVHAKTGSKGDEILGGIGLLLREIDLGPLCQKQVQLLEFVRRGILFGRSKVGILDVSLSLQKRGETALTSQKWVCPFYDASVDILSASDVPKSSKDVLLVLFVVPLLNKQRQTTKPKKVSKGNVIWNHSMKFSLGDYENDCFQVGLYASSKSRSEEIARCLIPVSEFPAGSGPMERDYELRSENKPGQRITLKVRVEVTCSNLELAQQMGQRRRQNTVARPSSGAQETLSRETKAALKHCKRAATLSANPARPALQPKSQDISEWRINTGTMIRNWSIGQGLFGHAQLVEDPLTGQLLALKSIPLNPEGRGDMMRVFMREVEMLVRLVHPCLLPFVGYSEPTKGSPAQIATLYAEGRSIQYLMDERRSGSCASSLDETGIATIIMGMVLGMRFIHSCGVTHGDLKPSNILLDKYHMPQIGDLGSGRLAALEMTVTQRIGPQLYRAPEMDNVHDNTAAMDVYSFALIAYELLVGDYVFLPTITEEMLKEKSGGRDRPALPASMNGTVKEIISRGWSADPSQRGSFKAIFRQLEGIDFRITPNVDVSKVREFVSNVIQDESTAQKQKLVGEVRLSAWVVDLSLFQKIADIDGYGVFGELYRARDPRTGGEVAIKLLREEMMSDGDDSIILFRREAQVLASVDHETLLSLRGYVPPGSGESRPAIVTDYMRGGSLQDLLKAESEGRSPSGWDAAQKLIVLYGIATGMKILHGHRIIHRDLKPGNVLLNDHMEPKVADFGLSKFVDPDKAMKQTTGRGTPLYMAPEISETSDYTFPIDVYAYGMLTYATVTGKTPFESVKISNAVALIARVMRGERPEIPPNLDKGWHDIITQCWSGDPSARPEFEEICRRLAGDEFTGRLDHAGAARFLAYRSRVSPKP